MYFRNNYFFQQATVEQTDIQTTEIQHTTLTISLIKLHNYVLRHLWSRDKNKIHTTAYAYT